METRGRKKAQGPRVPCAVVVNKRLQAELALAFFVDTMYNRDLALPIRLNAAREILDRVEGKPAQSVHVRTWQDEVVELIRAGGVDQIPLSNELGQDQAAELFRSAGISVSVNANVNSS